MGALLERMQCRAISDRQASCCFIADRARQMGEHLSLDANFVTRGAIARIAAHTIARCKACDIGANRQNTARKLACRRKGQLRFDLIFVGNDQKIKKVQRSIMNAHQHFASCWNRIGQLLNGKIFYSAKGSAQSCAHSILFAVKWLPQRRPPQGCAAVL